MVIEQGREIQHSKDLSSVQEKLSVHLFDIGAVKFGDFRLKLHEENPEAPLSPIYIDLRLLRRFPEAKKVAIDVYCQLIEPLSFDFLADIPTAATPLVSSLSDRIGIGMITPRMDAKTYGSGAKIDGLCDEDVDKTAVLIDDLITRADSKIEAVRILNDGGIKVFDVVTLIDREQGGREQLEAYGLILHSALTMNQMLEFYANVGRISHDTHSDAVRRLGKLNRFLLNS